MSLVDTKNGPMREEDLDVTVVPKTTTSGQHTATEYRSKATGELVRRDLAVRIFQKGTPQ